MQKISICIQLFLNVWQTQNWANFGENHSIQFELILTYFYGVYLMKSIRAFAKNQKFFFRASPIT